MWSKLESNVGKFKFGFKELASEQHLGNVCPRRGVQHALLNIRASCLVPARDVVVWQHSVLLGVRWPQGDLLGGGKEKGVALPA